MDAEHVKDDLVEVLFTEDQIRARIAEMVAEIERDYAGKDLLSALSCRSPGALILALCLSTIERRR